MTSYSPLQQAAAKELLRRRGIQVEAPSNVEECRQAAERERCRNEPWYFLNEYCRVYDATLRDWLAFKLWDCQREVLAVLTSDNPADRQVILLKARQLGMTWLCIGWLLHLALFFTYSTVLLFSRRDDEAMELLRRITGMHDRLPPWLMDSGSPARPSAHKWQLNNGSRVMAFPTGTGDSYTATAALLDEADLMPDLNAQLQSVKPTTDAGGKLVLLSRSNKKEPESPFKRIFRESLRTDGQTGWRHIFLPWQARPDRTKEWREEIVRESLARIGSLDEVYEQYPETPEQALAANVLDKRLPADWLEVCFDEVAPLSLTGNDLIHLESAAPGLPALRVFALPKIGRRYVLGADPAEGNPTSDDSAASVLDAESGEQVAALAGKFQPSVFASMIASVATWYNKAGLMVERNNHGHAVLLWLRDNTTLRILNGPDNAQGWLSNSKGKAMMYDTVAERLRASQADKSDATAIVADASRQSRVGVNRRGCLIHDRGTFTQLASIEGATLRAPEGQNDDKADAFALACCGQDRMKQGELSAYCR